MPRALEISLRIREPGFEVTGIYRATRDGRMRIDIFAEGRRVFAEALDSGVGREWRPDAGVTGIGRAAAAALRHGIELPGRFFTFAEMTGRGHRVRDLGKDAVDGEILRRLEVILDDGFRKQYWLDPSRCRVVLARDVRAFHPSVDPTEATIEARYSDFRRVGALEHAFRTDHRNADTHDWLGTTVVEVLLVDPDLSAVRFDLADLAPR
jgi:hypothetical protein